MAAQKMHTVLSRESMISRTSEEDEAPHHGELVRLPLGVCIFLNNNTVGETVCWQKLLESNLAKLSKFKWTYPMSYILETLYIIFILFIGYYVIVTV